MNLFLVLIVVVVTIHKLVLNVCNIIADTVALVNYGGGGFTWTHAIMSIIYMSKAKENYIPTASNEKSMYANHRGFVFTCCFDLPSFLV